MNIDLEPPPVQLPADLELRVRDRILTTVTESQGRRGRRWVPALVAASVVAAVAGVAAGTARLGPDEATTASGSGIFSLDAGPVSAAERDAAARKCRPDSLPGTEVIWGRRVYDLGSATPRAGVAIVLRNPDGSTMVCAPTGDSGHVGMGSEIGKAVPQPGPDRPLVPLQGGGLHQITPSGPGDPTHRTATPAAYRVLPTIARLESRLVWDGGSGEWYRAAVVDGIAYTSAMAGDMPNRADPQLQVEHRAFDAEGNPVPLP